MTLRPGIHWVRMPLPFALNHINLWVLDDEAQGQPTWTVVDAGVHIPAIHAAWQALWRGPMASRPLGRMLVTHMHPDHVGNAQWLIEHFSAPEQSARLWMSAGDFLAATLSCQSTTGYGGERAAQYFRAHGLYDADSLAKIRERGGYYAAMVPEMPQSYRRLQEGMQVQMGAHTWRCIAGFGHAPEHMAQYSESQGVLISGDMLLPKISTNVSVTDLEPEADALGQFLNSLTRYEELPLDTLVLPSHGHPFVGIHERVQQLRDHHEAMAERHPKRVRAAAQHRSPFAACALQTTPRSAPDHLCHGRGRGSPEPPVASGRTSAPGSAQPRRHARVALHSGMMT